MSEGADLAFTAKNTSGGYSSYVANTQTGAITREVLTWDGRPMVASQLLSGDGRYVVFSAEGDDIAQGQTGGQFYGHVYQRNLQTGAVLPISFLDSQTPISSRENGLGQSRDGRYVLYSATTYGATTFINKLYVRDNHTGANILVSLGAGNQQMEVEAYRAFFSSNGRYVGFTAYLDPYPRAQLLVRDLISNTTAVVLDTHSGGSYLLGVTDQGDALYHVQFDNDNNYIGEQYWFHASDGTTSGLTQQSPTSRRDVIATSPNGAFLLESESAIPNVVGATNTLYVKGPTTGVEDLVGTYKACVCQYAFTVNDTGDVAHLGLDSGGFLTKILLYKRGASPPSPLVSVTPASGIVGTEFIARYACAVAPSYSVVRTDGQPTNGVVLGIPVTGNGVDYTQSVQLNIVGSYILRVACGSQVLQSDVIVVTPPPSDCKDAAFIGVRGSGDNHGDSYPGRHAIEIARLLQTNWGLGLYDQDGGNGGIIGLAYPASSATNPFAWPGYPTSVNSGVSNLLTEIGAVRAHCGATHPILLTGFSQGAHVIQTALEKLDDMASQGDETWRSIAGVALIASPRFDPDDSDARGTFAASYPKNGIVGAGLIRDRFNTITRTYCVSADPVCVNPGGVGAFIRHTRGYDPGTTSGQPILNDAAGLLAYEARLRNGGSVTTAPTGVLQAFELRPGRVLLSAGAVYANGAPTTSFAWDLNGDGASDATTAGPLATFTYNRVVRRTDVTARISLANGSEIVRCIRLTAFDATRC